MRLALAIALAACTPAHTPCDACAAMPPRVVVDVCIDDALDAAAARDACAAWTAATCGLVELRPRTIDGAAPPDDCDVTVFAVRSDYAWIAARGASVAGFADVERRMVWVVVDRVPTRQRAVIAHELGHALGVEHGTRLMRPTLSADADECIDRHAAIVAALNVTKER